MPPPPDMDAHARGAESSAAVPETPDLPQPGRWRLGVALWLLGMPGVVAVVWALLPPLAASQALLPLPLWAVLFLSGLQTAVMLALAVAAGVLLAPRVGLGAPVLAAWLSGVSGTRVHVSRWLVPGAWGGLAGAAWLFMLSAIAPESLRPAEAGGDVVTVLVKLLYGGVTEELLVRWGVMTLVLWGAWRLVQRGRGTPGRGLVAMAIVASALLFALGHLPAAQAMAGSLTMPVVLFVLVGNTAFGLLAGWLFARRGLEAAITAHVLAHALSTPWM
ncbi:MAG: CPBP family intramembrane metalloprotease [Acidovorax sp.]|uniref:CPBP family intramembrane glutamic endopeptidase n=1 Tax=Acidovorax sp. TaxID=1872122 RepID=UPI0025C709BC|nr:CPBP family intramembrane glutamic endopeptidase [Acidovorax sp.]MDH4447987.1 CPBP family intramembrane metalloprotease [Acidovorax sp.]